MSTEALKTVPDRHVVGHFIGGQRVAGTGRMQDVFNPATGQAVRQVALADRATVERAIAAAEAAYPAWRDTPPLKRARIMFRFKELLERHSDEIVALLSEEHGKVLHDAMGELQRGIEVVEYACGAPELLKGEHSKNVGPAIDSWSEFQPLGVVAGITPFNFPAMVPMWMYPIAIVCGNTFVLKPSERDPSAPTWIAELLQEAGLPDGVFNVVNGDREAVETLLTDARVQAVSFVGSTPVAEHIYRTGTARGKRVQALGGAKNHAIVMPDADLDNAVSALMGAAYGSCGERCMAISVAVAVGEETGDALVAKLSEELAELKTGPGCDNANDMGPLVTGPHRDKVRGYIDLGVEEGAELVVDGRELTVEGHDDGFFLGGHAGGHGPDRRPRVRQRHLYFHPRRRGGALLHGQHPGRHGRRQRPVAGAGGLAQLRRLETLAVRRPVRLRPGRGPVLHAAQDDHAALAFRRRARTSTTRFAARTRLLIHESK
jgi:malonate-semialdehyde dehydrogenase (acetylating)/methylmalonate-semialdehyde dehydrogenase